MKFKEHYSRPKKPYDVQKLNLEGKKLHRASLELCLVDVLIRKITCPGQLQDITKEDAS